MTQLLGRAAAVVAVAALLAGCGGNTGSSPEATGPTSGSTSTPPSGASSPSGPTSSTSSVAAATGRKIDVEGFSIRVPKGFDRELAALARIKAISNSRTSDHIGVAYITSIGPVPLSQAVRIAKRNTIGGDNLKRLSNVEVAGQEFYHLAGKTDSRTVDEQFGAIVDGALCSVRFDLTSPPAARKQIIASTMASFTLN
ncbi:MAG: hypothetical protein ACR2K3_07225 [Nocardioides sp.]